MPYKLRNHEIVEWIGSPVSYSNDKGFIKTFYREFKFRSIHGKIGDFILVSNADSADPDTVEGCEVAEILQLFESKGEDPFSAKVRWYSRTNELKMKCVSSLQLNHKLEVIQDNRSFDDIVSIETFFSLCQVIGIEVDEDPAEVVKTLEISTKLPTFLCRYKLVGGERHTFKLEPYLQTKDNERTSNSRFHNDTPAKNSPAHRSVTKSCSRASPMKRDMKLRPLRVTLERSKGTPQDKRVNGNKESEFDKISECSSDSWIIKNNTTNKEKLSKMKDTEMKANESACLSSSVEFDKDESIEEKSRSCSPIIPLIEPSLRWHGEKDEKGNLKVVKIPIKYEDSDRPLKSKNSQKIVLNGENEMPKKIKEKSKKNIWVAKLKSEDISQLLEQDEDEDDGCISDLMEDCDDDDSDDHLSKKTPSKVVKQNSKMKSGNYAAKSVRDKSDSTEESNINGNLSNKDQKNSLADKERTSRLTSSSLKHCSIEKTSKFVEKAPSSPRVKALKNIPKSPRIKALSNAHNSPRMKASQEIPSSPRLQALREKMLLNESNNTPKLNNVLVHLDKKSVKKKLLYEDSMSDLGSLSDNSNIFAPTTDKIAKILDDDDDDDEKEEEELSLKKVCDKMVEEKCTVSRRRKRANSDSDYESESNIKRIKIHKKLSESPKSIPENISPLKKSERLRRPNKKYDNDEWEAPLMSSKKLPVDSPRGTKESPVTRGSRRLCKPNKNSETYTQSPKKGKHKSVEEDDEDWDTSMSSKKHTEASRRTPKSVNKLKSSETPTSKKKILSPRRGLLTPSMPERTSSVLTPSSALQEARARLHVAAVPTSLPCREKEFDNIYYFVLSKIVDGAGGCMYISGVPGTGKTATVKEVVRTLQEAVSQEEIPDFQFIELNGMRLTEPRQAYVQLLKQLTGQTVVAEQAQQLLERRFTRPAPKRITTLLLVDELDLLWTRRQDVVYNLLDWPTKNTSRLVVLTIANTMDLPERLLMGRVTSRLGLTRVTFHPYSHKQLQQIVMARLAGVKVFDPDAVQLVARKVAAVSGDARRALDICRRATELAEIDDSEGMVEMKHVDQALTEMVASTKVQAIRFCSKMEQLFLQAVAAEVQRTGVEETSFHKVYMQLRTLCTFDGYAVPSITEALGLCSRLGSCRLLLTEHSRTDIYQRVLLNVSCDDIHYALKIR